MRWREQKRKSQALVSLTLQDIKQGLLPARDVTACALPSPEDRPEVENHRSGGNTDQAAALRSQYLGKTLAVSDVA